MCITHKGYATTAAANDDDDDDVNVIYAITTLRRK